MRRAWIEVRVVAISASEQPVGPESEGVNGFLRLLDAVGFGQLTVLKPMGIYDVTYFDCCVLGDEEGQPMVELQKSLHRILFPKIPLDAKDELEADDRNSRRRKKKWRNALCDVMAMWSHIHYRGTVFITRDRNFTRPNKLKKLIELGAGSVMTPCEAAERLSSVQGGR